MYLVKVKRSDEQMENCQLQKSTIKPFEDYKSSTMTHNDIDFLVFAPSYKWNLISKCNVHLRCEDYVQTNNRLSLRHSLKKEIFLEEYLL